LDGVKVLIVDDEADARELLATLLRQSGAVVTVVDIGKGSVGYPYPKRVSAKTGPLGE
jgi:CheY-like chemotaxis protein